MFGLGSQELIVILVIALVLFGGSKLPELALSLGRSINVFKKGVKLLSVSFLTHSMAGIGPLSNGGGIYHAIIGTLDSKYDLNIAPIVLDAERAEVIEQSRLVAAQRLEDGNRRCKGGIRGSAITRGGYRS